jgi:putative flippase GtrA
VRFTQKNKNETLQAGRFLVAGGLNFLGTYIIFIVLLLPFKFHYLAAAALAFLSWSWLGFAIQSIWVFKTSLAISNYGKYVATHIFFFGASIALLTILVEFCMLHPSVGQGLATAVSAMGTYIMSRNLVFRKKRTHSVISTDVGE